jgi:hypothetical protein
MVAKYWYRVKQMGQAEDAGGCYDWQVENINLEPRPKFTRAV